MLHESMAEGRHHVTDVPVFVSRVRNKLPMVGHGGRYQDYVSRREGLYRVARHSVAPSLDDVQQLPGIMSVQLCFLGRKDTNIHKKEGVVCSVGSSYGVTVSSTAALFFLFSCLCKSMTNIFYDNTSIQQKIVYHS